MSPFIGERVKPDGAIRALKKRVNGFSSASDGIVHFTSNGGIVVLKRLR